MVEGKQVTKGALHALLLEQIELLAKWNKDKIGSAKAGEVEQVRKNLETIAQSITNITATLPN